MRKLDESKVYSLEELTSEEYNILTNEVDISVNQRYSYLYNWGFSNVLKEDVTTTNAKELFYTLENVQVDCRELSKDKIKEMANVFEANCFNIHYEELRLMGEACYLHNDSIDCSVYFKDENKHTITYEKFMELFAEPQYEVKYIAEEPKPEHYSKGIDTFARMEANCTTEECLAFAKGNIDKYNFRTKGQDLEDYKKIVSYANWAIKLLENAKNN